MGEICYLFYGFRAYKKYIYRKFLDEKYMEPFWRLRMRRKICIRGNYIVVPITFLIPRKTKLPTIYTSENGSIPMKSLYTVTCIPLNIMLLNVKCIFRVFFAI